MVGLGKNTCKRVTGRGYKKQQLKNLKRFFPVYRWRLGRNGVGTSNQQNEAKKGRSRLATKGKSGMSVPFPETMQRSNWL